MQTPSARTLALAVLMVAASIVPAAAQTAAQVPDEGTYTMRPFQKARVAIPDFATTGADAAIGRTIAEVLWNDLEFEHEFVMTPRDASTDAAAADAVIQGTVDVRSGVATVEVRLVPAAGQQEPLFARRYTGSTANPRAFAHTIADQIHEQALLYVTR